MEDWADYDRMARGFHRASGGVLRGTLTLGDDTGPVQLWQFEGYPGEIRSGVQRLGQFGTSSMPLPGAKVRVSWQRGHRGFGTIDVVEDPRYRLKGLKGGESAGYMVDGADAKGEGGTMRKLWQGAIGWAHSLFGATIAIGSAADTTKIDLYVKDMAVTVHLSGGATMQVTKGGTTKAVKLADGSNSTVLFAE